jgi:hypothetical protein
MLSVRGHRRGRWPFDSRWLAAVGLVLWSPVAYGQTSVTVDVPLTQGRNAAQAFVDGFGGALQGGNFDNDGWTTTSRDDRLWVPLPAGVR